MPNVGGLALFCDDIRLEAGGKVSYMGIYGNDMLISGPSPVLLPKLSIAAHIQIPSSLERANLKVLVLRDTDGNSEELISMEGEIERPPNIEVADNTFTQAILHLNAVPFQITKDCDVKVRAYVDGEEFKLGTLPIRFVDQSRE
jgi:hypothetical protein